MVAVFLAGELTSEGFAPALRDLLRARRVPESLFTDPDLNDRPANETRRALLATTRGYGEDRELFEHFIARVRRAWGT
jgi:hypothetical protein